MFLQRKSFIRLLSMCRPVSILAVGLLIALLGTNVTTLAQDTDYQFDAQLTAQFPAAGQQFGAYVTISADGSTLAVGNWEGYNSGRGSVEVFVRDGAGWTRQAYLVGSDSINGDNFSSGLSLSGDGNTMLVGAWLKNSHTGAAYVFTRSGGIWTEQAKLVDLLGTSMDIFGVSTHLSYDGNTAVVGAARSRSFGAGAAFVFTRSGTSWSEQARLTGSSSNAGDLFGHVVRLSDDGNTLLVGARSGDGITADTGAAWAFTRSGGTWTEQGKLYADDGANGDWFASSAFALSADGNIALVGAMQAGANDTGAAYFFTRSGGVWTQAQKITPGGIASGDNFGTTLALSADGSTAIVTAYMDDDGTTDGGAAYVFTRNGALWQETQQLLPPQPSNGAVFGHDVAISDSGSVVVLGAHSDDTPAGMDAGAAYVFRRDEPTVISPVNATPIRNVFTQTPLTLTWNPTTWAESYRVEISPSLSFPKPLSYEQDSVPAGQLWLDDVNLANGRYYWRVCARRGGACRTWSAADSFVVAAP